MSAIISTGFLHSDLSSTPAEILLYGELLADRFPDGERIGGAPFNVARHLKAFGLHPRLISRIGVDELGRRLLDLLTGWGMDITGIQTDPKRPTGQVLVHLNDGGHRFEILDDQAYDHIDGNMLPAAKPALLYFGTLVQRREPSRRTLQTLLHAGHAPRFLDLNLRPPWYDRDIVESSLAAADVLKVNGEELAELAALLDLPPAPPQAQAAELMTRHAIHTLLVTEGANGAWLMDARGVETRVSGQAITAGEIADTVGAGDAFSAVFLLGMLQDWPSSLILDRANAFARAICGIRGAVPLDDFFYRPFLDDWPLSPAKEGNP